MRIATYRGGMFDEGKGDQLACCLCGEQDYPKLFVQRIGMGMGMMGDHYTFCDRCWHAPDFGRRLARLLGFERHGLRLLRRLVTLRQVPDGA